VWPDGHQLAANMNFRFPQCVPSDLQQIIPQASRDAIQLMSDLMSWNPKKRPTASQALKYVFNYFIFYYYVRNFRYPYYGTGQNLGPQTTQQQAMQKLHSEHAFGTHSKPKSPASKSEQIVKSSLSSPKKYENKSLPRYILPSLFFSFKKHFFSFSEKGVDDTVDLMEELLKATQPKKKTAPEVSNPKNPIRQRPEKKSVRKQSDDDIINELLNKQERSKSKLSNFDINDPFGLNEKPKKETPKVDDLDTILSTR